MKLQKRPLSLLISAILISAPVAAQTEQDDHQDLERIVVTASPLERTAIESAQPIYVMSGDALRQSQAATLGETLRDLPGVQSSYYSPTSSSPVIRGLDGPRVRILQNGLDVGDVSRGGPDHAVSSEVSTAQQIEVLRGPATLLYGSGASGGIVNVVDNRIPRQPLTGTQGQVGVGVSSAANERHGSASLQQGNGDFVLHIDGFKRDADDYRVPEFTTPDGEHSNTIENSFTDDIGATVGASYHFDRGFFGASYGRLERDYGIPGHAHGHEEENEPGHADEHGHDEPAHADEHDAHDEGGIFARMVQDRVQLMGQLDNPFSGFERLNISFGYTELTHEEVEDSFVESAFSVKQSELRIVGRHDPIWGWRGALGTQLKQEDYNAYGAEAFTPPTETQLAGLFWLGERRSGNITWELGARAERVEIDTADYATLSYTPVSASFGATLRQSEQLVYSASLSYSERAPQSSELFSNGAHFATRTYDIGGIYEVHEEHGEEDHGHEEPGHEEPGHDEHADEHMDYHLAFADRALRKETSTNLDLGVHYDGAQWHFDANVFYNQINDFIYTRSLGFSSEHLDADLGVHDDHADEHDGHAHDASGLAVYQYVQQDADLYGFEVQGHYLFNDNWKVGAFTDFTRAKLQGGAGNVPRIPAMRSGMDITYTQSNWDASIGYTQYWAQNDTAEGESATDAFGQLNAYLNFYPQLNGRQDIAVYVKAENLTNRLGFVHNSFIRDYAPLPGMNVGAGVRISF
ncbi:TonB-dependent receptor [Aliidiomarina sp. Khilg15.8]